MTIPMTSRRRPNRKTTIPRKKTLTNWNQTRRIPMSLNPMNWKNRCWSAR